MLTGYEGGSDLTILNATYHRSIKDDKGKWSKDSTTIVFKDNTTDKKHHRVIYKPEYTYYKTDETVGYNQFFIDKNKVVPVTAPYKDLEKSIAEQTGRLEEFYDNVKCGNRRGNKVLHLDERIFGSDIQIDNYYRKKFAETYSNDITPINKSYLDIEANTRYMKGDFPQPGECPINAVSVLVDKTNTLYTFVLREPDNPLIKQFEDSLSTYDFVTEFKNFITENVGGWKKAIKYKLDKIDIKVIFYDDELDMLYNIFRVINMLQPDFVLAWNMAFDIPYIIERIKNLGADPRDIMCHPDFPEKFCEYFVDERNKSMPEQRGDYADISSYSVYLDQLIQFASRRKGQSAVASFRLDDVGEAICKVKKMSYKHITTDLAMLPYLDFKTFIMYNMMDVIVQKCIEESTNDINYSFNKTLVNSTTYQKVHRQTVYLANRAISSFMKNNDVIAGNNANKFNEKPEGKFPGAFVASPMLVSDKPKVKINGTATKVCRNANDFDYKRLYPSLAQESNMAPNTQIGMIEIPNKIYWNENPNDSDKFSRAGVYIENLASKNYIDFCHRWMGLGNYEEVYDDIVEYYTTKRNCRNGVLNLRTSEGIRDVAFRALGPIQIARRVEGALPVAKRYRPMPKEVENKVDEYRKAMSL